MEEGIWISVRLEQLISVTHLWREKKKSEFWLFLLSLKNLQTTPFARMCPNQACNYNLKHAVQCNSSRQFKRKTVHTVSCTPCSSITKQIILIPWSRCCCCCCFPARSATFGGAKQNWEQLVHRSFTFSPRIGEVHRLWRCYFKSLRLESEWEED